jgi:hypothetical protein
VRAVVLFLACVLATACTTVVPGTPSAPTGVLLPPRPREVRLDGVDPCSLLTPEQRAELGLTSEPRASRPYVGLFRGEVATCTVRGPAPGGALLVSGAVTTVGIERWTENDVAATLRTTDVLGFPALIAAPQRFDDYCNVEVDVAPGQLLDVQFGAGTPERPVPQDEICVRAHRSAELMMSALLGT